MDVFTVEMGAATPDHRHGFDRAAYRSPARRLSARSCAWRMGSVLFRTGRTQRHGDDRHVDLSKAWPIPDAGLGAVAYALEILMAAMGDRTRWRTMPWMVMFFGILVVPLGVVSIYFIIIQ